MVYHPPPPAEPRASLPKFVEPAAADTPAPVVQPVAPLADRPTEPLTTEHRLTSIPQALSSYNHSVAPLGTETIATAQALSRCLAEAPRAQTDLPAFTQSAMDGYALRSTDTTWASAAKPVRLRVIGEIPAGPFKPGSPPGENVAYRIFTGATIPEGMDAVAPQEQARIDGEYVCFDTPVAEKRNIRYRAEELKHGDVLCPAGQRISPGLMAALMAAGTHSVTVYRRPRIRALITGDEIVQAGQTPVSGQVHDANGPLIRSWLVALGYPEPQISYVKDSRLALENALVLALSESDLVITSGGVSVGSRDYLPQAAEAVGVRQVFWKVSQKPGKPLFFGMHNRTPLLGLPGNPASVLAGLVVHVRRVLDCLEGQANPGPRLTPGRLLEAIKADPTRDLLLRMNLAINPDGMVQLNPLPKQESHMLSNLATAMAMVLLPARERDYASGERVLWTPLPGVTRI